MILLSKERKVLISGLRGTTKVFRRSQANQRRSRSSSGRKINSLGRHNAGAQTKGLTHSLSGTFHQLCPNTRLSTHGIVAGRKPFHRSEPPLETSDEPADQAGFWIPPSRPCPSRLRNCQQQIRRILEKKRWELSCEKSLSETSSRHRKRGRNYRSHFIKLCVALGGTSSPRRTH